MKISKSLLAGMMVAGFAAAASASTTEIYLAGSTAFRGAVTKAVMDVLATSPLSSGTFSYAWDGGATVASGKAKNVYGAGEALFVGTFNSNPIVIHTYWTGSAAGAYDLASARAFSGWIPDNATVAGMVPAVTGTNASGNIIGAYTGGTNIFGGYTAISGTVNLAMTDAFASSVATSVSTASSGTNAAGAALIPGSTLAATVNSAGLTQSGTLAGPSNANTVGILPFEWVAGASITGGTPGQAPFSNITQQAAAQLIDAGSVPLGQLATGTSGALVGDTNDYAFLVGRNEDSGTRIVTQAEAQVGNGSSNFGNNMVQYYAVYSGTFSTDKNFTPSSLLVGGTNVIETGGTAATITDIGLWPANQQLFTEPTVEWTSAPGTNFSGHSGQVSGGDVATMLEANTPVYLNLTGIDGGAGQPSNWDPNGNGNSTDQSNKAYIVGYIGVSDASSIPSSNNAKVLTYNGVAYGPTDVFNGNYSFWGFEHMYYKTGGTNAIGVIGSKGFADTLADALFTQDCQTNSSGVTELSTLPDNTVGGLLFNSAHYTRAEEGGPVSGNY